MKKKTHKTKKHYKKLPPHTWEGHTTASHGEVNKQLIIGIVTIFAVVVLASLLFFTDVFVGQAITYVSDSSIQEGVAGIFLEAESSINPEGIMTIPVHAHLPAGKESTVVKFTLTYPSEKMKVTNCAGLYASLDEIFIVGNNDFSVVKNPDPCSSPGMIVFEFAALTDGDDDHVIKGLQKITDIAFEIRKDALLGPTTLTFSKLEVYDLDTNENIFGPNKIKHADIVINEVKPEVCTNAIDDNDNGLIDCEDLSCNYQFCANDKVCVSTVCTPSCTEDSTCPEEQYCNLGTNHKIGGEEPGALGFCADLIDCSPLDVGACEDEPTCEFNGGFWDGVNCRTAPGIKVELVDAITKVVIEESLDADVISEVEANKEYDVIVTIDPETDLPDNHLVFITIKSGTKSAEKETTMFYDTRPSLLLASGEVEVVKFNYKPSKAGIFTVSALVWGNWPSSGTGNYLLDKKEVNYEAK